MMNASVGGQCARCSKHTLVSAATLLASVPTRTHQVMLEQIHGMGSISDPKLGSASRLTKKAPLRGKPLAEIRVALIRPLGSESGGEEKVKVHQLCEPYQQELLAQALINRGCRPGNVRIFDQLAAPFDPKDPSAYPNTKTNEAFVREIASFNPDVIGIGSFTYNFRRALTIAANLKAQLGVPVILGGYHATSVGKQYLLFDTDTIGKINPQGANVFKEDFRLLFQHGIVDYACIGEGIRVLPELLAALRGEKEPRQVSGLAFRTKTGFHVTAAERVPLEEYPLPSRSSDFDPMMYYSTGRRYPMLLMSTKSGCRFSCEFCSTAVNYPGLSFRSAESVVRELQLIKDHFHSRWPNPKIMVNFTDEDFAANPERVIKLCKAIVAAGLQNFFEFNSFLDNDSILGISPRTHQSEPQLVDLGIEMLTSMRRAGFVYCFVGIESMDERVLKDFNRPDVFAAPSRIPTIQTAIDRMAQYGPAYFGDYISGHPLQTLATLREDHAKILELRRMLFAYFPILAPMPGTPLYWKALWGAFGDGFLPGVTYDHLDANHQVLALEGGGSVLLVRNETVRSFFTRPEYGQDVVEAARTNPRLAELIANTLAKLSGDFKTKD